MKTLEANLQTLTWPQARLGELLAALSDQCSFLNLNKEALTPLPSQSLSLDDIDHYLNTGAQSCHADAQSLWVRYGEIEASIRSLQPGIVRLKHDDDSIFFAVVRVSRTKVSIITPNLKLQKIDLYTLVRLLKGPLEKTLESSINKSVASLKLRPQKIKRVRQHLLQQRLSNEIIAGIWALRPAASAPFARLFKQAGLWRTLASLLATYAGFYLLWIVAWGVIGLGALNGHLDGGWLTLWGICLLTIIPTYMLFTWQSGKLSLNAGALIKRKLLQGIMHLDSDAVKTQGIGQLLGRVIESSDFERLALAGGIIALVSLLELGMAVFIILNGLSPSLMLLLLGAMLVIISGVFRKQYLAMVCWTASRINLTTDLVENMVGHRTRIAQQPPNQWHDKEDFELQNFLLTSRKMDKYNVALATIPRSWLIGGLLVLCGNFIFVQPDTNILAISLGSVLLCYRSLISFTTGLQDIAKALIAWQKIQPIFKASHHTISNMPLNISPRKTTTMQPALLHAQDLSFSYLNRHRPVLKNCSFTIHRNDKILLEGGSGGGKSTLASCLNGLTQARQGLLLYRGLDKTTLGEANWRKKIILVPQFHENHIFMGPFAFNLLMGHRWPPTHQDMAEAEKVCTALGLDELVTRMPGGMMQLIGDTGWQLSHGEKSRVYIARALLQKPDFLMLDESFASLDPENTTKALDYIMDTGNALMVIAHP